MRPSRPSILLRGPVNVLAVEEYEDQPERHGFLTEQRADVEASLESLKRTIREINQTSSERFRETLAEVDRSFGEIFTQLFRGGEAEMRLQDEEDLQESGIEIVARPRRRVRPCRTDTSPEPEAAGLRAGRGKAPET